MYFIVGTLYIIYIKKIYEEADSIVNKLTEKGIININIDNQSTEEPPIKESKNK
jgi:hypothetical protein